MGWGRSGGIMDCLVLDGSGTYMCCLIRVCVVIKGGKSWSRWAMGPPAAPPGSPPFKLKGICSLFYV